MGTVMLSMGGNGGPPEPVILDVNCVYLWVSHYPVLRLSYNVKVICINAASML